MAWRTELAVQRAHPMGWFVGGLVLVWYAQYGREGEQARWDRPWYRHKREPSFQDMMTTLRRLSWQEKIAEVLTPDGPHKKWVQEVSELMARVG